MDTHLEKLLAREEAGAALEFVFFWSHHGEGPGPWAFSQWWPSPFVVAGERFATAEHWMMVAKARLCGDEGSAQAILATADPAAAKALGRRVSPYDDEAWSQARFESVCRGNEAKFRQHPDLGGALLSTGDAVLVEASPYDRVWGIGRTAEDPLARRVSAWRGDNLLGFALMEVRRILRQKAPVG